MRACRAGGRDKRDALRLAQHGAVGGYGREPCACADGVHAARTSRPRLRVRAGGARDGDTTDFPGKERECGGWHGATLSPAPLLFLM